MSVKAIHDVIKPEFDKINIKINVNGNNVLYKNGDTVVKLIFKSDTISDISPIPDDYSSNHFYRIIKNRIKDKDLFETVQIILEFIPIMYTFCTVCGCKLLLGTNKVTSCFDEDKECIYKIESMLTDDTVISSFKRDKETFLFLIQTAANVCLFPTRLNPYPYYFKNDKKYFRNILADKANSDFFDMDKLKPIADKIGKMNLSEKLENIHSDVDIYQSLGEDEYAFIKYVIKSNRANILSSPYVNYLEQSNKTLTYTIDNSLEFYELKYHTSIESEFDNTNSIPLFHGSSAHNWHPIMRMGIKNLSNTKLMAHGAALGPGVYLAKDIGTAMGYCGGGGSVIVGVCLVKNYEKYKKNENVYVVPNDNDILLKHLIYIKQNASRSGSSFQTTQTKVSEHFKRIHDNTKVNHIIKISKIVDKRLQKEKKILEHKGFIVTYDSIELWNIKLPDTDNVKDHVIQIYFSHQYPIEPPIINITSHMYQPGFHCVMEKGVIFVDSIIPCEWVPNSKIINILKIICKNLSTIPVNMKEKKAYGIPRDEIIKTYHYLTNSLNLFNI